MSSDKNFQQNFNYTNAGMHLLVAIFFGIVLYDLGEAPKYLFFPYVIFLIAQPRKEHFPALFILMCYGTVLTIFGALVVIVFSFTKLKEIMEKDLFRLWLMLIISLPVYIIVTIYRISSIDMPFTEAIAMDDYYVAFWFLLYGALCAKYITRWVLNLTTLPLVIIFGLAILDFDAVAGLSALKRTSVMTEIMLIFFIIKSLSGQLDVRNASWAKFAMVLYILFRIADGVPQYKFTFFIAIIISSVFMFNPNIFQQKNKALALRQTKYRSLIFISVPFAFLAFTLYFTPYLLESLYQVDTIDYYGGGNIIQIIGAKIFVDRGTLWLGVIQGIQEHSGLLPPVEQWLIKYSILQNEFEVDFESHNLFLGLIRYNGFIIGPLLAITYLRWMYKLAMNIYKNDPFINVFRLSIFGVGIAVFTTGQYTLSLNASFFFMAFTGALALRHDYIPDKEKKKKAKALFRIGKSKKESSNLAENMN